MDKLLEIQTWIKYDQCPFWALIHWGHWPRSPHNAFCYSVVETSSCPKGLLFFFSLGSIEQATFFSSGSYYYILFPLGLLTTKAWIDHKLLFSVCSKTYLLTRIYSQLKQPTSIKVEKKKMFRKTKMERSCYQQNLC